MPPTFPEEIAQEKCEKIINQVLGQNQLKLFISNFVLKEDDKDKKSHISCSLSIPNNKKLSAKIKGDGDGFVDALFNAAVGKLSSEFCSLKKFSLDDFSVRVDLKSSRQWNKTDAPVEIKLAIKNLDDKRLYFTATSRSLVVAVISAIRKAIGYLINVELAVVALYKSIQDATKRNRVDLVQKDTMRMTELVRIVSYEETIAKIKTI